MLHTSRRQRRRLHAAQMWVAICATVGGASFVPLSSATDSGALAFTAKVQITYPPTTCPAGTPPGLACFTRTGTALVRGLGAVEESYAYILDESPLGCPDSSVRGLPSTARLTVPGKGAIDVRVSGTDCLARVPPAPVYGDGRIGEVCRRVRQWHDRSRLTGTAGVAGNRYLDRHARRARPRVRLDAAHDQRCGPEDGTGTPQDSARACGVQGNRNRRRRRSRSGCLQAEVGKRLPDWPHDGALLRDGCEREHGHGSLHGDGRGTASPVAPYG
jgi:hypothetical protein